MAKKFIPRTAALRQVEFPQSTRNKAVIISKMTGVGFNSKYKQIYYQIIRKDDFEIQISKVSRILPYRSTKFVTKYISKKD